MALIAASVPLLTNRTISTAGKAEMIVLASWLSASVGMPKLVPRPMALDNAATTCSLAWPAIIGP